VFAGSATFAVAAKGVQPGWAADAISLRPWSTVTLLRCWVPALSWYSWSIAVYLCSSEAFLDLLATLNLTW